MDVVLHYTSIRLCRAGCIFLRSWEIFTFGVMYECFVENKFKLKAWSISLARLSISKEVIFYSLETIFFSRLWVFKCLSFNDVINFLNILRSEILDVIKIKEFCKALCKQFQRWLRRALGVYLKKKVEENYFKRGFFSCWYRHTLKIKYLIQYPRAVVVQCEGSTYFFGLKIYVPRCRNTVPTNFSFMKNTMSTMETWYFSEWSKILLQVAREYLHKR